MATIKLGSASGTGRGNRAGDPLLIAGDTFDPPAISESEIVGQPDVGDVGVCLALAGVRHISQSFQSGLSFL
jgi:hypothetical protein